MAERKPFELEVEGHAEIPHMAERAKINIHIANSGSDKAAVSREVLDTARQLEALLRELSAKDDTPEAKEAAPLAYWSKTSLSATSRIQYDKDDQPLPDKIYSGSINFDIRFRDFKALGGFSATVSTLPHVEVQNINWILTTATEDRFQSELRKQATKDAMEKARDYCGVLGCTNIRPVELREGSGSTFTRTTQCSQELDTTTRMAPARLSRSRFLSDDSAPAEQEEMPVAFEFTPQEVRMDWTVYLKFHADPTAI